MVLSHQHQEFLRSSTASLQHDMRLGFFWLSHQSPTIRLARHRLWSESRSRKTLLSPKSWQLKELHLGASVLLQPKEPHE